MKCECPRSVEKFVTDMIYTAFPDAMAFIAG
jgi:hypothetical protein